MVTTKPHAPQYADSIMGGLRKIVGKEGFLAFWKGNGTSVIHRFPYSAINFQVFESSVDFLSRAFPPNTQGGDVSGGGGGNRGAIRFASGALAGAAATATCYPLDLVRTRLTTQVAGSGAPVYHGIVHCLQRIGAEEGLRGLYNGLGITLLVQVPNLAISYSVYGSLRDFAMRSLLLGGGDGGGGGGQGTAAAANEPQHPPSPSSPPSPPSSPPSTTLAAEGVSGAGGGGDGALLPPPLQRRATLLKSPSYEEKVLEEPGLSAAGAAAEGNDEEDECGALKPQGGASAAPPEDPEFRSAPPPAPSPSTPSPPRAAVAPAGTAPPPSTPTLSNPHQRPATQVGVNLLCGGLSGIVATLCIFPLDVVRRRMQLQGLHRAAHERTAPHTELLAIVRAEGVRGCYRGIAPELCKIVPMVSTTFGVYELMKDWLGVDRPRRA